jgi:hypothetical protein
VGIAEAVQDAYGADVELSRIKQERCLRFVRRAMYVHAMNVRLDVHGVNIVGRRQAIGCGGQMSNTAQDEDNRRITLGALQSAERDLTNPIVPPSEPRVIR